MYMFMYMLTNTSPHRKIIQFEYISKFIYADIIFNLFYILHAIFKNLKQE